MKELLIIVLASVLLIGCNKGKADLTITGVINDQTHGTPLSGASVKLYSIESGSQSTELLLTSTLGTDGVYTFTFPRDQVEGYKLLVEKTNYFTLEEIIQFGDLTIEEDNHYSYATTAKSWVKLTFQNTSPLPTDILDYNMVQGKSDCEGCHPAGTQSLIGAIDTSFVYLNDGNEYFSYYYNVIGGANSGTETVTTDVFDTTEIILTY
ncbi:MAG: hypothetical protein QNK23_10270 [Crocinitomicaceae bacterium]|nr:hypothetical protein [Crocinitomicaceae bacterium]